MTKHGVVLGPEDAVVAAAAARHFSFPPPRTGADSCKKLAAQVDLGAAAVMGSWLDSMKASSPRHRLMAPLPGAAADAEHDDWMVSGYTPARPPARPPPILVVALGSDWQPHPWRWGGLKKIKFDRPVLQERHPSALDRFDALAAAAKGKQIAVFLDYDGTLSPIVEDPDRAVMTDEVRS
jgi:trehalose 6-phosphate phosphatase